MTRVTVYATTDRIEAHALRAMLESAGVDAELVGVVDAARIGVGETALPVRIEVPAEDEARARELLSTPPPPPAEPAEDRPRLKRPIIALGVPVVWPGLGHVYAGRPYSGLLLGLGALGSIIVAGGRSGLGAAYVFLLLADAVFARRAVQAHNAGRRQGVGGQLVAGAALVVASLGLAGSVPLFEEYQRAQRARELARVSVSCPAGRVAATNTGDAPRDVEIASVRSVQRTPFDEQVEAVDAAGARRAVLEPGDALVLWVDPALASPAAGAGALLGFDPVLGRQRELRLDIIVRRSARDDGVWGTAYCTPR